MQNVARRAVESYLRAHEPDIPIGRVIDEQLARYAGAVEHLGRWTD